MFLLIAFLSLLGSSWKWTAFWIILHVAFITSCKHKEEKKKEP